MSYNDRSQPPSRLPSRLPDVMHVTFSPRPSPSLFAYSMQSKIGGGNGLGTRLSKRRPLPTWLRDQSSHPRPSHEVMHSGLSGFGGPYRHFNKLVRVAQCLKWLCQIFQTLNKNGLYRTSAVLLPTFSTIQQDCTRIPVI